MEVTDTLADDRHLPWTRERRWKKSLLCFEIEKPNHKLAKTFGEIGREENSKILVSFFFANTGKYC